MRPLAGNLIILILPSEYLRLLICAGLETLELHYYSNGTVLPALLGADQVDGLPSASLRQLVYCSGLSEDPYLHLLLMRHAATLEVCELKRIVSQGKPPCARPLRSGGPTGCPVSSSQNELLKYITDPI